MSDSVADILTPEQRKRCMASVRTTGTAPEVKLRKELWKKGMRYRIKSKLPGKPDILFPFCKLAIFVDGCFWHNCPLHGEIPKTNTPFWKQKIERNVERDKEINDLLQSQGWSVLRVWEHAINDSLDSVVLEVSKKIEEAVIN